MLARLLKRQPRPHLLATEKTLVLWSAKAACTIIFMWILRRNGLQRAAQLYHPWPHEFRTRVLEEGIVYDQMLRDSVAARCPAIKFVRDPFARAVSSYRHAARHGYENDLMSKVLDAPIDGVKGFSFLDFLTYLSSIDIRNCDIHHRCQRHEIEDLIDLAAVINCEGRDILTVLRGVEESFGWTRTEFEKIPWFRQIRDSHFAAHADAAEDVSRRRFSKTEASSGTWPTAENFRNPATSRMVEQIYQVDYESYGDEISSSTGS